jgi:hypothetical protein
MLKRSDLTSEAVEAAVGAYRVICQAIPFEELQTTATPTVTPGNSVVSLSAVSPSVAGIVSVRYVTAAGRSWRLKRSHVRAFDNISYSSNGDSRSYARFGLTLELQPPPQAGSSLIMRYWSNPTIDGTPGNTNLVTPLAWDELFKWETLYRLYFITSQEDKAAALIMPMPMPRQMSPKKTQMFEVGIIPRLYNDLLKTINMREAVDEDFSVNPIRRRYA